MQEIFELILEIAVYAPSGDNMQPWRFAIQNQTLYVFNVPKKDTTLYNFKSRAAFISHGGLLENISIIAPTFGYEADISYFPESSNPNLTATVTLNPKTKYQTKLFAFIKQRATNRKPYKDAALTNEQRNSLLDIFPPTGDIAICLIENPDSMKKAAVAACQGDRLIFENKTIHDFLFSHIRWTEQEELREKNGLYLKTMELAPPQVAAFKILKKWNIMKIFNAIGFPKMAVKSNFSLYKRGSAFAALLVNNNEPKTCVELGRLLQRFWLTATTLGLSIQPLTAIPFLMQRIKENQAEALADYQKTIIQEAYKILAEICHAENKTIGFFLRLGIAPAPSGTSSRLAPEIEIK